MASKTAKGTRRPFRVLYTDRYGIETNEGYASEREQVRRVKQLQKSGYSDARMDIWRRAHAAAGCEPTTVPPRTS